MRGPLTGCVSWGRGSGCRGASSCLIGIPRTPRLGPTFPITGTGTLGEYLHFSKLCLHPYDGTVVLTSQ